MVGQAAAESRRVGSICTGAFLLAHAGLLDGRPVATHWAFAAELAKRYPKVKVDPEPIWVQDGNFYTSAGVTADKRHAQSRGAFRCSSLRVESRCRVSVWTGNSKVSTIWLTNRLSELVFQPIG